MLVNCVEKFFLKVLLFTLLVKKDSLSIDINSLKC